MKVFISSVISGFETYREAAVEGAKMLRHSVVRAEDFGAVPGSPQQVCLAGVREADVVLLVLGERYGEAQPQSGLSPTHEEFQEARERCDLLVFVQKGVTPVGAQKRFLAEVRDWASGHYTGGFTTPEELREAVVSALHDLEMSRKGAGVDEDEMVERAKLLAPHRQTIRTASICLIVVGAPRQQIIRPAAIEEVGFARAITQEALFGANAVLSITSGSSSRINGDQLLIEQEDASILVDQLGSVRTVQPAQEREGRGRSSLPVLLQEEILERLQRGLTFASWVLDRIDAAGRLSWVTPVAALLDTDYVGWKTRAEHRRDPNTVQMGMRSNNELAVVLSPAVQPRAALRVQNDRLAEDLMVLLRRQVRS